MITTILAHPASAPAIRTPAAVVTYGELATRITVLAHRLAARGLGPERVCALAVPRGVDAVVAMAAVLHTGAAFLSLDVEAPPARLSAMATSAEAEFLLTTTGVTLDLALPRLDLDTPDPAWAPLPPVRPNALAYVSHTSGSTGTPNAVQIERRSLESYLDFLVADYGLGPHTTCLQLAPQGYDASIRDTLAPLVAGGQLVLVPRSALLRPKEFAEVLTTHGVNTILSTTPSFLTAMSEVDLSRLSLVVSSGESLRPFLAAGGRG
ncbi:AMP-binding protein, partial [Crossiella equi]